MRHHHLINGFRAAGRGARRAAIGCKAWAIRQAVLCPSWRGCPDASMMPRVTWHAKHHRPDGFGISTLAGLRPLHCRTATLRSRNPDAARWTSSRADRTYWTNDSKWPKTAVSQDVLLTIEYTSTMPEMNSVWHLGLGVARRAPARRCRRISWAPSAGRCGSLDADPARATRKHKGPSDLSPSP
jgi:hypothetical protein